MDGMPSEIKQSGKDKTVQYHLYVESKIYPEWIYI